MAPVPSETPKAQTRRKIPILGLVSLAALLIVPYPAAASEDWCSAKPANGSHTLPASHSAHVTRCALRSEVHIAQSAELRLATALASGAGPPLLPAVISGGGVTRLFHISGGTLELSHLILERGYNGTGAAILVENGGQMHVFGGRTVVIRESKTDNSHGGGLGGAIALIGNDSRHIRLMVSGTGTTLSVSGNVAQGGGALYASSNGVAGRCEVIIEEGAQLDLVNNTAAGKNGGGAHFKGAGTRLLVSGIQSKAIIEDNNAELQDKRINAPEGFSNALLFF